MRVLMQFYDDYRVGDLCEAGHLSPLPDGGLVEHVQRSEIEQTAVPVGVRILIERPIHLHKAVFSATVIFGVVADAINVIGVVVQWPRGDVFEMVVVAGSGPLIGWWDVVGHCLLRPSIEGMVHARLGSRYRL